MSSIRKSLSIALVSILAVGFASSAMAETAWQHNHPRRVEVNHRLANQDHRINREVHEGEISHAQAHALHKEDHQIRNEERAMASQDHGHLTKLDQRALKQQENGVSHQIGH